MYCISDVSYLRLSCCINAFIFYLCSLLMPSGWVYVCLRRTCGQDYETLFHGIILSKYHHHQYPREGTVLGYPFGEDSAGSKVLSILIISLTLSY
jgi:hypothetical protein